MRPALSHSDGDGPVVQVRLSGSDRKALKLWLNGWEAAADFSCDFCVMNWGHRGMLRLSC